MSNPNDKENSGASNVASSDILDTESAIQIIESCNGFDDPTSDAGRAWQAILKDLELIENAASMYLQRLQDANRELRGTRASIVHELELAGVTRTYDDEEINSLNYLQGIRILRDRANSFNTKTSGCNPTDNDKH